jgi:hypothetical protein
MSPLRPGRHLTIRWARWVATGVRFGADSAWLPAIHSLHIDGTSFRETSFATTSFAVSPRSPSRHFAINWTRCGIADRRLHQIWAHYAAVDSTTFNAACPSARATSAALRAPGPVAVASYDAILRAVQWTASTGFHCRRAGSSSVARTALNVPTARLFATAASPVTPGPRSPGVFTVHRATRYTAGPCVIQ